MFTTTIITTHIRASRNQIEPSRLEKRGGGTTKGPHRKSLIQMTIL